MSKVKILGEGSGNNWFELEMSLDGTNCWVLFSYNDGDAVIERIYDITTGTITDDASDMGDVSNDDVLDIATEYYEENN